MLRGEAELAEPWAKQMVLGLGLLFLGKQGAVEATVEVCALHSSNPLLSFVFRLLSRPCGLCHHEPQLWFVC